MRLVRFTHLTSQKETYGLLRGKNIIPFPELSSIVGSDVPQKLEEFIALGLREGDIQELLKKSSKDDLDTVTIPMKAAKILAPIVKPSKIICLGLNYKDHAQEQGRIPPQEPIIFMKPRTTIIGPEEKIVKPTFVTQLDYEAELAIIIGERCKNITLQEAKRHIFGYTAMNDVTARSIQFRDKQWTRGKSFDTFAPIGPCITTVNQIGDPNNLRIYARVNDETRQNSTTSNMMMNVYQIIHHLNQVMTLEPCDIISTGTPAGPGFTMSPPRFLRHNDVVEIEIEGIGILRNRVCDEGGQETDLRHERNRRL
ncbi:MAG: fumarylacetoacetate hydrolase family protein [Candidatus Bathyarchaeota archaeon]|nr:MAG: fumarylacetoacetate hydrolase family protein [Candidatus Bathyarchaeota archaeon]